MNSSTENEKVEYRVRKVERYIVTRFESSESHYEDGRISYSGGSESFGEFDNASAAYKVALGLCKTEHADRGWPQGDGRIVYPDHPDAVQGHAIPDPRGQVPSPPKFNQRIVISDGMSWASNPAFNEVPK